MGIRNRDEPGLSHVAAEHTIPGIKAAAPYSSVRARHVATIPAALPMNLCEGRVTAERESGPLALAGGEGFSLIRMTMWGDCRPPTNLDAPTRYRALTPAGSQDLFVSLETSPLNTTGRSWKCLKRRRCDSEEFGARTSIDALCPLTTSVERGGPSMRRRGWLNPLVRIGLRRHTRRRGRGVRQDETADPTLRHRRATVCHAALAITVSPA